MRESTLANDQQTFTQRFFFCCCSQTVLTYEKVLTALQSHISEYLITFTIEATIL